MEYDKQLNRSDLSLVLDDHINKNGHIFVGKKLFSYLN